MQLKKYLPIIAGAVLILLAIVVVDEMAPDAVEKRALPNVLPPVSVLVAAPQPYAGKIDLIGRTSAYLPVALKASSSAQLDWLDIESKPGSLIKKGQLLAKLNKTALEANLAEARSLVKQAELNLQQVKHEQTVSLKVNPNAQSAFAKREPQVAAARAALTKAVKNLENAQLLRQQANMLAPFDAVLLNRYVSPNQWIDSGQVLFDMAASESINVVLPISQHHWQRINKDINVQALTVIDRDGKAWPATLRFQSPQINETTGQRQLVLAVTKPFLGEHTLLSNQQVRVLITTQTLPFVAKLPLSAITRDGFVWTLDANNRLQKELVTEVEQLGKYSHVVFDENPEVKRRIVRYSLASMLVGKQVAPVLENASKMIQEGAL